MTGCHSPSEDDMDDDDDREFLAAASLDDALVATLLVRLSRSEVYAPTRQLPPTETGDDVVAAPPLLPGTRTWGRRRARSAPVVAEGAHAAKRGAEEEEAGGASPATPLSWSGASGSGSEDGWPAPPRPPKRRRRRIARELAGLAQPPPPAAKQRAEVCHGGGEQIGPPPAGGATPELRGKGGPARVPAAKWAKVGGASEGGEPRQGSVVGATAAVGSPGGSGRKATAEDLALRSRWTGGGANSVAFGRQGKKKTVLELRAMEESLLREQERLQKDLGKHREIYDALLEKNTALKKLESNLPCLWAGEPTAIHTCGEAKSEELHPTQSASEWGALEDMGTASVVHDEDSSEQPYCTSSSSPEPTRSFLFDLNFLPDSNL